MDETIPPANAKGHLDVGDGHSLYFEDWGNPNGKVFFNLHGGPGSYFKDRHKKLYDPLKHRVIFHDQRGAGRSTPFADTSCNTSQHLVEDIERLRKHLGVEKLTIAGGSWGSTLALLYALSYPERVDSIVIWSLFLARQFEVDFVNEGYPRYFFPEAWRRFIALVPGEHRTNGDSIMRYYAEKIRSEDEAVARKHAVEWSLWEGTLLSLDYDPAALEKEAMEDDEAVTMAKLETHYFMNGCFIPENHILESIGKLRDIPCDLVQGRFDMCSPPISALDLKEAYGENLTLTFAKSGHLTSDPGLYEALKKVIAAKG